MSTPRRLIALAALALLTVLSACGDPEPETRAAAPWTGPVEWTSSKPNAAVGAIRAAVVERPSTDRAVIEARWQTRAGHETCTLELLLPDAVVLLDGVSAQSLDPAALEGSSRWLVEFPVGRDLDAVVRCHAHTADGQRACEVAVRLVNAPGNDAD